MTITAPNTTIQEVDSGTIPPVAHLVCMCNFPMAVCDGRPIKNRSAVRVFAKCIECIEIYKGRICPFGHHYLILV